MENVPGLSPGVLKRQIDDDIEALEIGSDSCSRQSSHLLPGHVEDADDSSRTQSSLKAKADAPACRHFGESVKSGLESEVMEGTGFGQQHTCSLATDLDENLKALREAISKNYEQALALLDAQQTGVQELKRTVGMLEAVKKKPPVTVTVPDGNAEESLERQASAASAVARRRALMEAATRAREGEDANEAGGSSVQRNGVPPQVDSDVSFAGHARGSMTTSVGFSPVTPTECMVLPTPAVESVVQHRSSRNSKASMGSMQSLAVVKRQKQTQRFQSIRDASMMKDLINKGDKKTNESGRKGVCSGWDSELAKLKVREAIAKNEYSRQGVLAYYKDSGWFSRVASHPMFDNVTMTVILLNTIWMGVDTELNNEDVLNNAHVGFVLAENLFCLYFTMELVIRFGAFENKQDCLREPWFVFDVTLVVCMIAETWVFTLIMAVSGASSALLGEASILRFARILRVLRTARMARLVRSVPELMILMKGMVVAARTVFFTLFLLGIIIYIFAIAFTTLSRGTAVKEAYFSSLSHSMESLLLKGILPDQSLFVSDLGSQNFWLALAGLVFILIGSLIVMNMLLGVLVEVVKTVSLVEREQIEVSFAKRVLSDLLYGRSDVDTDERMVTESEFLQTVTSPIAARALASLGVDVVGVMDYIDLLFVNHEPLPFAELMEGMLMLRGSNTATVKDFIDLRKFIGQELSMILEVVEQIPRA